MKNNKFKRLLLWAVLPMLLAGGVGMAWTKNHADQADNYLMAKVERGNIEDTVSALGTLQPLQYVDVGTQVTGQLKRLYFAIGNQVKRHDLVAEIDPTLFALRVETTEASLENAKALLSERIVLQRLAKQQYARNTELYASQAVSEDILQQSKAAVDQAAAQCEALNAQIKQIQAQLNVDRANLRYTEIFAPISGTIVSINAREGQTLVSSQQAPTILRIADLNTMVVWAQVSEADSPRITLGMPVYFTTLGLPERRWQAAVKQIMPMPDSVNNVILYNVLFEVSNQDQVLKPQMSAQTSFVAAKAENALLVPVSALQAATKHHHEAGENDVPKKKKDKKANQAPEESSHPQKQQYTVRVLKEDGQIEERLVEVGVKSRTSAEVLSGLAEGENVIIGAAQKTENKNAQETRQVRGRL